jgi:hypothetical protein
LILLKILEFIIKICATTSNFLADIQIGFFTHSSKSTIKYSGITFKISLLGILIHALAASKTLSISHDVISSHEIAVTHFDTTTSKEEELKEIVAQEIPSVAIFSA